jgi:hypothetical protein
LARTEEQGCAERRTETRYQHGMDERWLLRVIVIAYSRGWKNRYGNTLGRTNFQLSEASEDAAKHGHDVFPRVGRTDGDVVPRIWARLGIRAAQYARKDTPVEIDEVVQTQLGTNGARMSQGKEVRTTQVQGGRSLCKGRLSPRQYKWLS